MVKESVCVVVSGFCTLLILNVMLELAFRVPPKVIFSELVLSTVHVAETPDITIEHTEEVVEMDIWLGRVMIINEPEIRLFTFLNQML
jgi:hypothetical protein